MVREGVDWLCDTFPTLVLPLQRETGDTYETYSEVHHLGLKCLGGHVTYKGNLKRVLFPRHMDSHKFTFQAFPKYPKLAAGLTVFQMGCAPRDKRGYTRAAIKTYMDENEFGPVLELAHKVRHKSGPGGRAIALRTGGRKANSGDPVVELIRHFHRTMVAAYNGAERPSYTENERTIICGTFRYTTAKGKIEGASDVASEIGWDPEDDKKMPKTKFLWPKELKEKTAVEQLLAKLTRAKRKKTLNRLEVTWAEQQIMWAYQSGNCSHGQKMDQASEKATEISYDVDADSAMAKAPYISKREYDKQQKDPIEAIIAKYHSESKKRCHGEKHDHFYTDMEIAIIKSYTSLNDGKKKTRWRELEQTQPSSATRSRTLATRSGPSRRRPKAAKHEPSLDVQKINKPAA